MNPRQALLSAIHLFVVAAFFVAGLFFISLTYLPRLKEPLFENSILIGSSLFLSALLLLLGFYALDRGRYLVIRMGVVADLQIVQRTLADSLSRHFSQKIRLTDVDLGPKSSLEIRVTLTPLEEDAREELYIAAEKHLVTLLHQRFGYAKPFYLVVKV